MNDEWEGENLETLPFLHDNETSVEDSKYEISPAKKIFNICFNVFLSISIGAYAGLSCRSMQEAWIYAAMFIGEAMVCACIAGIIKTYSFRKSLSSFTVFFVISAIVSPASCWLSFQFN